MNTLAPDESKGRYRVLMQDIVDCIALGDYGSYESTIERNILQKRKVRQPSMHVTALHPPHELSAALSCTEEGLIVFTGSQKVTLSSIIILHITHLPVRIHGTPFLAVDRHMDEILRGCPCL